MKYCASLALITLIMGAVSCTPKTTALDVCMQYKESKDLEARLRGRMTTDTKCEKLAEKFGPVCSQSDIDYAFNAFKKDADTKRQFKTKEQLDGFKSAFDPQRISGACNGLTP